MSSFGKDLLKLPQVTILDHFLQRYTVVRSLIHDFFSWRNSHYEIKGSTDNL